MEYSVYNQSTYVVGICISILLRCMTYQALRDSDKPALRKNLKLEAVVLDP